jgi:hypothetical protein
VKIANDVGVRIYLTIYEDMESGAVVAVDHITVLDRRGKKVPTLGELAKQLAKGREPGDGTFVCVL